MKAPGLPPNRAAHLNLDYALGGSKLDRLVLLQCDAKVRSDWKDLAQEYHHALKSASISWQSSAQSFSIMRFIV